MNVEERLLEAGYEDVLYLVNYDYEDALIGVTEDGRAVYNYELMVKYLMDKEGWSEDECIDWIEYNTIRALSYMGIIMYPI